MCILNNINSTSYQVEAQWSVEAKLKGLRSSPDPFETPLWKKTSEEGCDNDAGVDLSFMLSEYEWAMLLCNGYKPPQFVVLRKIPGYPVQVRSRKIGPRERAKVKVAYATTSGSGRKCENTQRPQHTSTSILDGPNVYE